MAQPTVKSAQVESALESMFGNSRVLAIVSDHCAVCNGPASEFRDDLSRREYRISGLCQECQDRVFG